jgi:hypothetical protein
MADQNRKQQGNRNRNQQSSQQGSERRQNPDNTQQTQGNNNPDDNLRDDEVEEIGSTDRSRLNREPASIANDRNRGSDRLRRDGEEGEIDELGADIEDETDVEDVDEDDLGSGGSNR